jgi:uncharacterized membrane protein
MQKKHKFLTLFFLVAAGWVIFDACGKDDKCDGTTTYNNKMKAIIDAKCTSCHKAGGTAESNGIYTSFSALQPKTSAMHDRAVNKREMPPAGAPQLTNEERDAFNCWKEAGFPQ